MTSGHNDVAAPHTDETPGVQAEGVKGQTQNDSGDSQPGDYGTQPDAERKELARVTALAAFAGCTLHELSGGGYMLSRWNLSRELPDLLAVVALLRPVAAFGDSMTYSTAPALQGALAVEVHNAGVGSTTSSEIAAALAAYPGKLRNVTIWAGHNDTGSAADVLASIAAMVAGLPHDRYIVLGLVLADVPGERIGGADRARKLAINAALAAAYPAHYIDVAALLAAWHNPRNPQDVADVAAGVTPSSLRAFSDALHLNAAGAQVVAGAVLRHMMLSDW